jgi:hypothetical protein
MEKQKENKLTPILYFIGIFLLIAFIMLAWMSRSWAESEIASQLFAALAGAVIAAFITSILLRLQTQSQAKLIEGQASIEQEKEKEAKVYEEKLRIYQDFLRKLNDIIRDNKIDKEEVIDLQFQVSFIDMHTSSAHIKQISEHVANIVKNINNPKEDFSLLEEMFAINETFREELYKKKDIELSDDNKQNRIDAVDNFKSITIYEKGNSLENINTYELIKKLKQNIKAPGFRQWIYGKRTLVHELYLNYDGETFRKDPWENSLCCDTVFESDGTINVLLFLRKNCKEATRKMLSDAIWKDYQSLTITEDGRCKIREFNKKDSEANIKEFFEKELFPKMINWRENHKGNYIINKTS